MKPGATRDKAQIKITLLNRHQETAAIDSTMIYISRESVLGRINRQLHEITRIEFN